MKHSYAFVTAVMLMAAVFAGVVIVCDESIDAADAGYTVSVDSKWESGEFSITNVELRNELTVEDGAVSGTVKKTSNDKVKEGYGDSDAEYYYIFSITVGKDKYVSFFNTKGDLVSAPASDGEKKDRIDILSALVKEDIKDGKASFAFEYVVTNSELDVKTVKDFEGFAVNTIQFDLVCDDKISNNVTWNADGITITSYDISIDISEADINKIVIPDAPSKSNYDFIGWAVDGKTVITYNSGLVKDKDQGYRLVDPGELKADAIKAYIAGLTADTVLTAVFEPVRISVTTVVGDVSNTITMAYNEKFTQAAPAGYQGWTRDLTTSPVELVITPYVVTEDITFYAVPEDVIVIIETPVYFVVDGEVLATYKAGEVTLPTAPVKPGYIFVGWAIGQTIIEDPVNYPVTEPTTFVAVFTPVEDVYYDVTFVTIDGKETVVKVAVGTTVEAIGNTEGYFWLFDFATPITQNVTITEAPLKVKVTFMVGSTVVTALEQIVDYGAKYNLAQMGGYVLPEPYVGWDVDLENAVFTKDTVVHAVEPVATVTVTFVGLDGKTIDTVVIVAGSTVEAIDAPEGCFWLFDFETVINEDIIIEAKPLYVTVTFMVGEEVVKALEQKVAYGAKYDMEQMKGYVLPEPYIGWSVDLKTATFTEDTVVNAVEPEPTTPFFSTQYGYVVIFLVVLAIIGIGFMIYKDMFGLKSAITGIKKKDKKAEPEAPASDATGVQEKQQ